MASHDTPVPHPLQGAQDGVITHAFLPIEGAGKDVLAVTSDPFQFLECLNHLSGKRDDVWRRHFHALFRNFPPTSIEVEFAPRSLSQFSGPEKCPCHDPHGIPGDVSSGVVLHGQQQLGQFTAIYTSAIGHGHLFQHVTGFEVCSRVAPGVTVRDGEPEDLTGGEERTPGQFSCATALNSHRHPGNVRCLDLRDRQIPQLGEDVTLDPTPHLLFIARRFLFAPLLVPLVVNGSKASLRPLQLDGCDTHRLLQRFQSLRLKSGVVLPHLFLRCGVQPTRQNLLPTLMFDPCVSQTHLRVLPD